MIQSMASDVRIFVHINHYTHIKLNCFEYKGPFPGLAVYAAWPGGFSCRFSSRFYISWKYSKAVIHTILFSFTKQKWCLCNNSQWMTINTTKQVFYLSCCEAPKSAPLPRADPPRQAMHVFQWKPRRGAVCWERSWCIFMCLSCVILENKN